MRIQNLNVQREYKAATAVLISSEKQGGKSLGQVSLFAGHIGIFRMRDLPEDYELFQLHFQGEPDRDLEWILMESSEVPLSAGFLSLADGDDPEVERFGLLLGRVAEDYLRSKVVPEWAPIRTEDSKDLQAYIGTRLGQESRPCTVWWFPRIGLRK